MKASTGRCEIARLGRGIQRRQLQPQLGRMLRLNPALVPRLKSASSPLCLKLLITRHRKPTSDALQSEGAVQNKFGRDAGKPLTALGH
jgi:hypothetical protein